MFQRTVVLVAALSVCHVKETTALTALSSLRARLLQQSLLLGHPSNQKQHAQQQGHSGPEPNVLQTIKTLDTNHDGKVTPDEVKAFAEAQHLDAGAITREFASLDLNGDGTLDFVEISRALGVSAPSMKADQGKSARTASIKDEDTEDSEAVSQDSAARSSGVSTKKHSSTRRRSATTADDAASLVEDSEPEPEPPRNRSAVELAAAALVQDLAEEESSQHQALALERKAAELRANSTALAEKAAQNAAEAGQRAALAKAQELMASLKSIQEEAAKAEQKAAELRASSRSDLHMAQDLMSVADSALQPPPAQA